jgi:hypothetical protein
LVPAALFGISAPAAKALVGSVHPATLTGLLYCGAGIGIAGIRRALPWIVSRAPEVRRAQGHAREPPLACSAGLRFNSHIDEKDGPLVFQHACKLGLEGIVSKRRNSSYRSGRSPDCKSKNPAAPAVKREAEEEWGRRR